LLELFPDYACLKIKKILLDTEIFALFALFSGAKSNDHVICRGELLILQQKNINKFFRFIINLFVSKQFVFHVLFS